MTASPTCPACGTEASGSFCRSCGARLGPAKCGRCQADLSPQARFCHRCGTPAAGGAIGPARERSAWVFAAAMCVVLVGAIGYKVTGEASAPVAPDMANPGAGGIGSSAGPAPDISQLTPRERFDRLFNRVMTAAERGDTLEVERFIPMAIGAYQQLDAVDIDARYHAAVLRLEIGDFPGAQALADTILTESPGHLFGYIIRGSAAESRNDAAGRAQAARDFLGHYDAEMAANRVEYQEHRQMVDEFKQRAESR